MSDRASPRPPRNRPLVYSLYEKPVSGEQIEAFSLEIVDREASPHGFSDGQWHVVRRLVHATADFGIVGQARFSPEALDSAIEALGSGRPIVADSTMIRHGLSLSRLRTVCSDYSSEHIFCHVADEDVACKAKETGLPRSLFAVRKAKPILQGSIAAFGNAPVGLMELNRIILEDGLRPALVIAMPVGFVHVVEAKEELMCLGVPYVCIAGRRGGSPLAVSTIHALCSLALREG